MILLLLGKGWRNLISDLAKMLSCCLVYGILLQYYNINTNANLLQCCSVFTYKTRSRKETAVKGIENTVSKKCKPISLDPMNATKMFYNPPIAFYILYINSSYSLLFLCFALLRISHLLFLTFNYWMRRFRTVYNMITIITISNYLDLQCWICNIICLIRIRWYCCFLLILISDRLKIDIYFVFS